MEQIVYTSRAAPGVSGADVFGIIETSARNNPRREVTGFLIFSGTEFLQVIEGPTDQLEELLSTLHDDIRHTDLEIQLRSSIPGRKFADWRMQRFDLSNGNPAAVLAALREKRIGRNALNEVERFLLGQRKAAA
jgi:hypothetical protein